METMVEAKAWETFSIKESWRYSADKREEIMRSFFEKHEEFTKVVMEKRIEAKAWRDRAAGS